ncbi:hypothetical protein KCP70_07575 [Salmonella enterica subsp. enterica]|nr:hypothetical protein KCP70_07575 [Salmonella enterica subsp. enterica]
MFHAFSVPATSALTGNALTGETVAFRYRQIQYQSIPRRAIVYQIGIFTRKLSKPSRERIAFSFPHGREILFQQDTLIGRQTRQHKPVDYRQKWWYAGRVVEQRQKAYASSVAWWRNGITRQGFSPGTEYQALHIFNCSRGRHTCARRYGVLCFVGIIRRRRGRHKNTRTLIQAITCAAADRMPLLNRLQSRRYLVARFAFAKVCHAHRVDIAKRRAWRKPR